MTLFDLIQSVILLCVGALCVALVLRRFWPVAGTRMRTAAARCLPHRGPAGRVRRALERSAPFSDTAVSGGCSPGGCSQCAGCALKRQWHTASQPAAATGRP